MAGIPVTKDPKSAAIQRIVQKLSSEDLHLISKHLQRIPTSETVPFDLGPERLRHVLERVHFVVDIVRGADDISSPGGGEVVRISPVATGWASGANVAEVKKNHLSDLDHLLKSVYARLELPSTSAIDSYIALLENSHLFTYALLVAHAPGATGLDKSLEALRAYLQSPHQEREMQEAVQRIRREIGGAYPTVGPTLHNHPSNMDGPRVDGKPVYGKNFSIRNLGVQGRAGLFFLETQIATIDAATGAIISTNPKAPFADTKRVEAGDNGFLFSLVDGEDRPFLVRLTKEKKYGPNEVLTVRKSGTVSVLYGDGVPKSINEKDENGLPKRFEVLLTMPRESKTGGKTTSVNLPLHRIMWWDTDIMGVHFPENGNKPGNVTDISKLSTENLITARIRRAGDPESEDSFILFSRHKDHEIDMTLGSHGIVKTPTSEGTILVKGLLNEQGALPGYLKRLRPIR